MFTFSTTMQTAALYCEVVHNLTIDRLTFILHSSENSSAIKVFYSSEIGIIYIVTQHFREMVYLQYRQSHAYCVF